MDNDGLLRDEEMGKSKGSQNRSRSRGAVNRQGGLGSGTNVSNEGNGGRGDGENSGKGERGAKGGYKERKSKGGKGGDGKNPVDFSVEGRLAVQGRLLQRLAQAKREEGRYQNFIIENEGECKSKLASTMQLWSETRPKNGKHPDGEPYECNWGSFIEYHKERLGMECITHEQKSAFQKLKSWEQRVKREEIGENGRRTVLRYFHPLGKKTRIPSGSWLWLLVYDMSVGQGRDTHEWTLGSLKEIRELGIKLREDRAPMDNLERQLLEQLRF
jgi:hypothetical protein